MTHYTCTSCGTEADKAGKCSNEDCLKEGQSYTACDCIDGEHGADYDDRV